MSIKHLSFWAVCLGCVAASTVVANDQEAAYLWSAWRPDVHSTGDQLATTDSLWSRDIVYTDLSVNPPNDLGHTRVKVKFPWGYMERGYIDPPAYQTWDPATKTATITPINPLGPGQRITTTHELPGAMSSPFVGLERSSYDGWVLQSDHVIRTYNLELTVPTGALSDFYFGIRGWMADADWDAPEGLSWQIVPGSIGTSHPGLFDVSDTGAFGLRPGQNSPTFGGTFHFSVDLEITRSGPLTQSAVGDLLFKPNSWVMGGHASFLPTSLGNTFTKDLAGGYEVTVTSEVDAFIDGGPTLKPLPQAGLETVVAAGPVAPQELTLFLQQVDDFSAGHYYQAVANAPGANVVDAQLVTPGGQTYPMAFEPNDDDVELEIEASTAAELAALGFVNGTYTFQLTGMDGAVHEYPVMLSGDYFEADPQFVSPHVTTDTTPTVTWQAPPDQANVVSVFIDGQDVGVDTLLFESDVPLDSVLSLTPGSPLPLGFYETGVQFADVDITQSNGVDAYIGYLYVVNDYLNVTEPILAGDANDDGQVDGNDLIAVEETFGATGVPGIPGDANRDGQVDGNDLIAVEETFGGTLAAAAIPEPISLTLLSIGYAALATRRRAIG